MRLATWNVNSLNVRLPHVLDWLRAHPVDVLCLQETKLVDERFPQAALREAGYEAAFAGQPTYNGAAILSRRDTVGAPADVVRGNPTLFMRRDEVEAAWHWAGPILAAWAASGEPPRPYKAGTWGPSAAIALIERDGRTWNEDSE